MEGYQTQGGFDETNLIRSYMPKVQAVPPILIELQCPLTLQMAPVIEKSKDYPLYLGSNAAFDSEQGGSVTYVETTKYSIDLHHLKAFTGATPEQDTFSK